MPDTFEDLLAELRRCRLCRDAPKFLPGLPVEPRPVIQASVTARLCIAGQAPGTRVHASGRPFTDPSGVRLRNWLGIDEATFYDESRVAIVPMGHCFPGLDAHGGDRPPRRECPPRWREAVFSHLDQVELVLAVGGYAQAWHLPDIKQNGLNETMMRWREILASERKPRVLPLPHPSWRNNAWLKRNSWFEEELVPVLRGEVARLMAL